MGATASLQGDGGGPVFRRGIYEVLVTAALGLPVLDDVISIKSGAFTTAVTRTPEASQFVMLIGKMRTTTVSDSHDGTISVRRGPDLRVGYGNSC